MSLGVDRLSSQRLAPLDRAEITDPALLEVLERAERLSTPKPQWFLTIGHRPELAVAYDRFWDLTFRQGQIDHGTKELMRVAITTVVGCRFCSSQRSVEALEGMGAELFDACALPDFQHPDPRVRAALGYAHAIATSATGGEADWDAVYGELHEHYDEGEVTELVILVANIAGGALVAKSLNLLVE